MSHYTLTQKAKSDLMEIGRYTKDHWGREQRNRYLAMLDACFVQLAANPLKGQDCSNIKKGYRKFQVGSHVVYYRKEAGQVEIIRVLHGHMNSATQLRQAT
jgi:toxin ParE1/3/4